MYDSFLFRVLLIPCAVILSVEFGASASTGLSTMQFASKYGPTGGLVSIATSVLTYAIVFFLCFEISRLFRVYEYRSFCDKLLGRAWFLYEIVIMVAILISLAVISTVTGALVHDHFDVPIVLGTFLVLMLVVFLNYFGRALVEKSMMLSVSTLFLILATVLFFVFSDSGGALGPAFENQEIDLGGWKGGLTFSITNTGFVPLLLYCARGLRTRRESLIAAAVAGLITLLPVLAFHLAFMTQLPAITNEALPAYFLFEKFSPNWLLIMYIVVIIVLISQTGVGLVRGFLERLDAWSENKAGHPLSRNAHGLTAGSMMVISLALSGMGVVALVLRAYSVLSASFVIVFTLPLLTWGMVLVFRREK